MATISCLIFSWGENVKFLSIGLSCGSIEKFQYCNKNKHKHPSSTSSYSYIFTLCWKVAKIISWNINRSKVKVDQNWLKKLMSKVKVDQKVNVRKSRSKVKVDQKWRGGDTQKGWDVLFTGLSFILYCYHFILSNMFPKFTKITFLLDRESFGIFKNLTKELHKTNAYFWATSKDIFARKIRFLVWWNFEKVWIFVSFCIGIDLLLVSEFQTTIMTIEP